MLVYQSLTEQKNLKIPNRLKPDYYIYLTNTSTVYPIGEDFNFKIGETDTMYTFKHKSEQIIPLLAISTKKHRFDENKIKEARKSRGPGRFENIQNAAKDGYSIQLLGETNKYYLFSVTIMDVNITTRLLFVDKTTYVPFFGHLKNDFQGGLPLKNIPYFYLNKYIIFHYPTIKLMNDIKQQMTEISNEKDIISLKKTSDNLTKDDNDILLICKMR
jgi:hypothetical protein